MHLPRGCQPHVGGRPSSIPYGIPAAPVYLLIAVDPTTLPEGLRILPTGWTMPSGLVSAPPSLPTWHQPRTQQDQQQDVVTDVPPSLPMWHQPQDVPMDVPEAPQPPQWPREELQPSSTTVIPDSPRSPSPDIGGRPSDSEDVFYISDDEVSEEVPSSSVPCRCGNDSLLHYCYSGATTFTGPNPGQWADSMVSTWLLFSFIGLLESKNYLMCVRPRSYTLPSSRIASITLLLDLVLCLIRGQLTLKNFFEELADLHRRRWKLACSSGPQTAEAEARVCNVLGWDNPILEWTSPGFLARLSRYFYLGDQWVTDIKQTTRCSVSEVIALLRQN